MTMTLERFQAAVAERRGVRKHGARKYEPELVAFALAHAEAVVAGGRSLHAASKELGVNMMTLQSWQRQARGGEAARLREVVVAAPKPPATTPQSTLTLTTSSGHIVRGLDAAQAVALLRALS